MVSGVKAVSDIGKGEPRVPSDPAQRREWIKYQLRIRGQSFASLARENAASRQAVAMALTRQAPRWEHVIASALGKSPLAIWPERYDAKTGIPRIGYAERTKA